MRLFLNDFQTLAYFESPVLSKWKFLKGVTICLERAATKQFRYFLQSVNFEGPLSGLCAGHRSKKEVLSSTTTLLC